MYLIPFPCQHKSSLFKTLKLTPPIATYIPCVNFAILSKIEEFQFLVLHSESIQSIIEYLTLTLIQKDTRSRLLPLIQYVSIQSSTIVLFIANDELEYH